MIKMSAEFKTFEYAEKNGDGVLIFSEEDEEQADRRLKEVVKFPQFWRLSNIREEY